MYKFLTWYSHEEICHVTRARVTYDDSDNMLDNVSVVLFCVAGKFGEERKRPQVFQQSAISKSCFQSLSLFQSISLTLPPQPPGFLLFSPSFSYQTLVRCQVLFVVLFLFFSPMNTYSPIHWHFNCKKIQTNKAFRNTK